MPKAPEFNKIANDFTVEQLYELAKDNESLIEYYLDEYVIQKYFSNLGFHIALDDTLNIQDKILNLSKTEMLFHLKLKDTLIYLLIETIFTKYFEDESDEEILNVMTNNSIKQLSNIVNSIEDHMPPLNIEKLVSPTDKFKVDFINGKHITINTDPTMSKLKLNISNCINHPLELSYFPELSNILIRTLRRANILYHHLCQY